MSWFTRKKAPKPLPEPGEGGGDKPQIPDDIWTKCPSCAQVLYTKELRRNFGVCPKCNYHFRLKALERIPMLVDRHTFVELNANLRSVDVLSFRDSKESYRSKLRRAEKKTGLAECVITGQACLHSIPVALAVFEFEFFGGSMGSVVGEKLTRLIETALAERLPLIIVSASGGARMQEGIYSLMQMAKVSAAICRLSEAHIPYISVLTNPTTGGVAASFAMQGDIILAEPRALIGFAGPRVIEQTIKQKLPEGFQRSEFLLEHGMLDRVVQRASLKDELAKILSHLGYGAK